MEVIRIGDSKLKIMLDDQDLKQYEIDALTYEPTDEKSRASLRGVLADVKEKTGFDAEGGKMLVQMYPCRGGGCEMYITKLKTAEKEREKTLPVKRKQRVCYRFERMEDMLGLCRHLHTLGYQGESSALSCGDAFYLFFMRDCDGGLFSRTSYYPAEEYGTREEEGDGYLEEHGTPLLDKNAVAVLSTLA